MLQGESVSDRWDAVLGLLQRQTCGPRVAKTLKEAFSDSDFSEENNNQPVNKQTNKQTDKQTNKNNKTNKQTNKQTNNKTTTQQKPKEKRRKTLENKQTNKQKSTIYCTILKIYFSNNLSRVI